MVILGINAYHGDVSAVLLRDGELVAAVEEERFQRVKEGKKGGEAGRRGGEEA
jgi:predicted NodU family carbamoyl transferase